MYGEGSRKCGRRLLRMGPDLARQWRSRSYVRRFVRLFWRHRASRGLHVAHQVLTHSVKRTYSGAGGARSRLWGYANSRERESWAAMDLLLRLCNGGGPWYCSP